ncbi:MAG: enoyl-CoA hydratase/isomerase family protein [Actinomycetota bacterium]|jgi:enoyl-CoA hydratase|nr:enoyl-CoA hydratase/isomerase family protein [Actinomycetota bacterium]MDA8269509.1 enoyl-CoA hydratase/isomerase family protein [Actinomycetota bacterium]
MHASAYRYETLTVDEVDTAIALVTLRREETLNALTLPMFDELLAVALALEADATVRAVVITGAGRGFCSGLDLDDAARLATMDLGANLRGQEHWARCITSFHTIDIPVVAAVNGPAAGAGFALALAADVRVAARSARFNAAFVRIGLSGGDCGTSYFLPRIVGLGRAYELLMTGRSVDAAEAVRIGLVNDVVDDGHTVARAIEVARSMVANSPIGVRLTKQLVSANVDAPSLLSALELENRSQVLTARSEDMVEALDAFLAKRPPVFRAR